MAQTAVAVKEVPEFEGLPLMPANDNAAAEFATKLRGALQAATLDEVRKVVKEELVSNNTLNRFELKVLDTTKTLEDAPRHYLFPDILTAVHHDIPAALIGPAGSGKSTAAEQVASALSLNYYLQNAVTGTYELSGYKDAHGNYHTTPFRTAFENGGLLFVDEVDTSDPGALKWMNTALANGHAMFPDSSAPVRRHADFRVIIGANTFGNGADRIYVGANQLDASTLDRFVFFDFGYDEKLEAMISGNTLWTERVQTIRKAALAEKARVVISPRASIYGAKMLAAGWSQDTVETRVVWKGIDPELRTRILDRIQADKNEAALKKQGWSEDLMAKYRKDEGKKPKKR